MLCALIMAGGKGTRFWPLSTEEKPKQFLNLVGNQTMIQMTVNRILPIIPIERIFICTGEIYVDLVKEQLPNLPERNIIIEPEGRNTAPCIALSALIMKRYYKDATMLVLPADHLIKDENKFTNIIINGNEFLQKNNNAILTFGMKPDRAETGYGYIYYDNNVSAEISKVKRFVEKPNKETAEKYLASGKYLWNGGMFIWKVDTIIKEIKKYVPNIYEVLSDIESIAENELQNYINNKYNKTEKISIDYGVLERSNEVYVLPSEIGWDDIGSWGAIERYRENDVDGNIVLGESVNIDSTNNIIISQNNNVIINKLSGIYVVENSGKIIIGNKHEINELNEIRNKI